MWNDRSSARGRRLGPGLVVAWCLGLLGWACSPGAGVADDRRSDLERLLEAADEGAWQWAARLAEGTGIAQLRSYVRWRELAESKDKLPFEQYAAFLRASTDWPGLGTVQTRAEEAMDAAVAYEERLAFFADHAPRTRQGRILYAEALIAAGRKPEAVAELREAWVEDDFGGAEEQLFLDRFGGDLDASIHAARLDRLLWDAQTRPGAPHAFAGRAGRTGSGRGPAEAAAVRSGGGGRPGRVAGKGTARRGGDVSIGCAGAASTPGRTLSARSC